MRNTRIQVQPIAGAVGAEISGVDLSRPLPQDQLAQIRQAFGDHGVIFFRDQELSPAQHVAFAEHFGPIETNRFFKAVDGWPMIAEVRKEPEQKANIGGGWHTDHSYDAAPALGSVLYAREVPDYGGDTIFASMYAAYDALSDGLKSRLADMRAVHSSRHVFGQKSGRPAEMKDRILNPELATQDAVHPVVIRHPDTGRPALYVNPGFTLRFEGWTDEEFSPAAAISVCAGDKAGIHLPVPLAGRLDRVLGQPLHLASGGERLPRPAAADAPDYRGRCSAALTTPPRTPSVRSGVGRVNLFFREIGIDRVPQRPRDHRAVWGAAQQRLVLPIGNEARFHQHTRNAKRAKHVEAPLPCGVWHHRKIVVEAVHHHELQAGRSRCRLSGFG